MASPSGLLTSAISVEPFHVGWVKDYTVDFTVMIREISAVHTHGNIRGSDIVKPFPHFLPENTLPPCYIGHDCPVRDMQLEYLQEHVCIPPDMSRSDYIARGNATLGSPSLFGFWRYFNLKLESGLNWFPCHVSTHNNSSCTSGRWRCRFPVQHLPLLVICGHAGSLTCTSFCMERSSRGGSILLP